MVLDMSHKESDNIQNMDFLLNHMNAQSGFYFHWQDRQIITVEEKSLFALSFCCAVVKRLI